MNNPELFKRSLKKPDGRNLHLYSRRPIAESIVATNPKHEPISGSSHLRWHPLREEWVAFASHRQNRTFLPPKEYSPLLPTRSPEFPTELPSGDYDVAVFENLFPSLSLAAQSSPELIVPTQPGRGLCEVVVFTQDPQTSLGKLSIAQIDLLLRVWSDRYERIRAETDLEYVLPFENRGVEVGVTLHHPHGQIYAYPFLPPLQKQMLQAQQNHWRRHGRTLLSDWLRDELQDGRRVVVEEKYSAAVVPVCARYPYEVWIAPKRPVGDLSELSDEERYDFARTLKTVLLKYDGLWQRPFPYLMVLHAAPLKGTHPEWHFHIEFYPPYRTTDKLKFLAGTELGAGMFVNDSLPEEKAQELKKVEVHIDGDRTERSEASPPEHGGIERSFTKTALDPHSP